MADDEELQTGEARYSVRDDGQIMQLVCECISATDNKVVLEADVKRTLGFRFKQGHRDWRRLKVLNSLLVFSCCS